MRLLPETSSLEVASFSPLLSGPSPLRLSCLSSRPLLASPATSCSQPRPSKRQESTLPPVSSLAFQDQLPKLPVPSLKDTLPKLLRTVRAVASEEQFEETMRCVRDLAKEGGEGHALQALLEARAAEHDNWMADWWLEIAYLGYRDPVIVWSSPGIVWPNQKFADIQQQIRFAARVISGALDYKITVDQQSIPVDRQGGKPLDMQQYFKVFGTCRIPGLPSDSQTFHPDSRHIVVIHRGHFYQVEVYGEAGELLSTDQIEDQLQKVVSMAPSEPAPGVGILTSLPRDLWAAHYPVLSKAATTNAEALKALESSLFTLSLDPAADDLEAHDDSSR